MAAHRPTRPQSAETPQKTLPRRTFLKLITLGSVGSSLFLQACTHKKLLNPDEDIILAGGNYEDGGTVQNALILINLIQKDKKLIDTPFLPHEILIDPENKYRILCFEKNGTRACEIDLKALTLKRLFSAAENQRFSGHAVFSNDGQRLYTVEFDSLNRQGFISVRDAKTLAQIKQLPTLGLSPHDCQLVEKDILVVSNTGIDTPGLHRPSLVYIDLNTEKLLKRIKLDDASLNAGHFKVADKNSLVVVSAPADTGDTDNQKSENGGISIRTQNTPLTTLREPAAVTGRMTGEALGIAINATAGVVAITHPDANLLTFWSTTTGEIIKAIGIEKPQGITQTLDSKHFVVSYGKTPAMASIAIRELTPLADSILQPTHTSGEHILNWSATLRDIMPGNIYD